MTITGKLYTLLYANYLVIVGAEAVAILSNRVSQINVQTHFMVDDNTWPLEQPTSFIPLLLIYYKGHRTPKQITAMAEQMSSGDIDKVASVTGEQSSMKYEKVYTSTATKEIKEILAPLEKSKKSASKVPLGSVIQFY